MKTLVGCFIHGIILPSYSYIMVIIISHCKQSPLITSIMECHKGFVERWAPRRGLTDSEATRFLEFFFPKSGVFWVGGKQP